MAARYFAACPGFSPDAPLKLPIASTRAIPVSCPDSPKTEHMMAEMLGVAIIGVGMMGEVHTRASRLAGGTVRGIAASTESRAMQAAERLGIARFYATAQGQTRDGLPTFDEGWRSARNVDAVLASSKANGWVRIE